MFIYVLMSALHAFEWGREPDKKLEIFSMHWGMGGNVVVWTYESREKLDSLRWKGKDHCHGWFAKRCVRTVLKYTELSMDSMTLVCLCVFLLGWCRNAGFHHCVIVGYLFLVNQSWHLLGLLPLMMIPSVPKAMDLHQHIVFSRALGTCGVAQSACGNDLIWWRQAETGIYIYI